MYMVVMLVLLLLLMPPVVANTTAHRRWLLHHPMIHPRPVPVLFVDTATVVPKAPLSYGSKVVLVLLLSLICNNSSLCTWLAPLILQTQSSARGKLLPLEN